MITRSAHVPVAAPELLPRLPNYAYVSDQARFKPATAQAALFSLADFVYDAINRRISVQIGSQPPTLIERMKARIDDPLGKAICARRLAIVEPVFANICVHKHMDRFTLRSKRKVDVQWGLFALVHNIGKIHVFGALG